MHYSIWPPELFSCDGRPAEDWARDILGDYVGLWFLPSERSLMGPLLLVDEGNPFVKKPGRCAFEGVSGRRAFDMKWTPIAGADLLSKLPREGAPAALNLRRVGNALWITIPTFNLGDAKSGAAWKAFTEEIRAQAPGIRSASAVVFDVRGNRGGSSSAGQALLAAIWSEAFVSEIQPRPSAIDWRLSAGNIRFLRDSNLRTLRRQFGDESPQASEYEGRIKEMDAALARGDVFYREMPEKADPETDRPTVAAKPILLTDSVCASACLDFADVVRRLPGALHVGRETSADAVYIDNRAVQLPSGMGFFGFSMKVYRGRARGNNETYKPDRVFPGDIHDTAALEAWVLAGR